MSWIDNSHFILQAKNQESGVKYYLQSLSHVLQGYGFLLALQNNKNNYCIQTKLPLSVTGQPKTYNRPKLTTLVEPVLLCQSDVLIAPQIYSDYIFQGNQPTVFLLIQYCGMDDFF